MLNPTAAAKTVVAEARTIEANGGSIAYTFIVLIMIEKCRGDLRNLEWMLHTHDGMGRP